MDNQAEIDAALDELEIDNNVIAPIDQPIDDPVDIVEPVEPTDKKDLPPGYKDKDQWVAEGKDPALHREPKEYENEYGRIQEIKELKTLMKEVVNSTSDWKAQQQQDMNAKIDQAREDAKRDLKQAKDDDDIDGALAAQEKLTNLKPEAPTAPPPSPVLTKFLSETPIIDRNSNQYDQEFFTDMAQNQTTIVNQLTGGNPNVVLSEAQMKRSLTLAYARTKDLYPEKFKSPRNNRKGGGGTPPKRGGQTPSGDIESRLKTMKIQSKNPRDTEAQMDVYNMIKAKDPKAAEKFAKAMLGE